MKIEILLPIFHKHRKKELFDLMKEVFDAMGIFQYEMRERFNDD